MRIGIYCPNWVGDAVMALPFFNLVRQKYPQATILAIGKSWVSAIFENHPAVDGILGFGERKMTGVRASFETGKSLSALNLDKMFLLSNSFRSAFIAFISAVPTRIGFKTQGRSIFLTHGQNSSKLKLHRSDKYLLLLGLENENVFKPGIVLDKHEIIWAKKELKSLGLVNPWGYCPFSVASARSIPINKSREFMDKIGDPILIFGSPDDRIQGEILQKYPVGKKVHSICGVYSLRESISLISQCRAVLATDSGLGHIAASLGIPVISIFGAGDTSTTGPLGEKTFTLNANVYCSPCKRNVCNNKKEPLLCFQALEGEKIVAELNNFLL
ncbi:MAG: lipopolysaccharide heptosyltransferase II [Candidatus Neomarinimicrobiota bacterium]